MRPPRPEKRLFVLGRFWRFFRLNYQCQTVTTITTTTNTTTWYLQYCPYLLLSLSFIVLWRILQYYSMDLVWHVPAPGNSRVLLHTPSRRCCAALAGTFTHLGKGKQRFNYCTITHTHPRRVTLSSKTTQLYIVSPHILWVKLGCAHPVLVIR